ncbi:MAG TPA: terminase small subunit [Ruminiclostridium sp.]|nr:terminase small subunit [Ruminiclostridium sp.]
MLKKYSKKRLKDMINSYAEKDSVKSLAGLALFLGLDRNSLLNLQSENEDGFDDLIEYARTLIEKDIVENGLRGKYNASMAAFILRSSFGYRDKGDDKPQGTVKIEVADELQNYAD